MAKRDIIPIVSAAARCCSADASALPSPELAAQLSADFQMLAHPIRLQILTLLAQSDGQVCVCELEAALPVKQPTVSHHLRLLREAGFIDCERHGQWAYYFINRDVLAAVRERVMTQLAALG